VTACSSLPCGKRAPARHTVSWRCGGGATHGADTGGRTKSGTGPPRSGIRDRPVEVSLTDLSAVVVGDDDEHVSSLVEELRPRRQDQARYAAAVHAGTVDDHIGRFRELAEAGGG
jgi:hypothetical protein